VNRTEGEALAISIYIEKAAAKGGGVDLQPQMLRRLRQDGKLKASLGYLPTPCPSPP
jgi:hypothetical protein